jgi:hypothetical protein
MSAVDGPIPESQLFCKHCGRSSGCESCEALREERDRYKAAWQFLVDHNIKVFVESKSAQNCWTQITKHLAEGEDLLGALEIAIEAAKESE